MALKIRSINPAPSAPLPAIDKDLLKRLQELEEAVAEISDRVDAILTALKEEFEMEIEEDAN